MEGVCGLDVPLGRLPGGSGPMRVGLFPWLRCVLQPRPVPHRESRAEIGLGDLQGAWQFFNILGLFPALSIACWRSGRGGRSLATGPWPRSRESPPCRSAGEEGLRQRPLAPPSPVEESTHRHFLRRSGCLVLDWFYPCCQRDGGEESGWPHWVDGVWALLACPVFWSPSLVCTLLAAPACPVGPSSPARQGWFVTNSLSA